MSEVQTYLDCGCAILKGGGREWCPTCLDDSGPIHPETGTTMPKKGTIQPPNGDKGASVTPADIQDPIDGEYNALPDDAALRDVDNNLPDVEVRPGKECGSVAEVVERLETVVRGVVWSHDQLVGDDGLCLTCGPEIKHAHRVDCPVGHLLYCRDRANQALTGEQE